MNKFFSTILLSLLGGLAGAWIFTSYLHKPVEPPSIGYQYVQDTNVKTVANRYTNSTESVDFVKAAELSTRSVVYIKTITKGRVQLDWFDFFFQGGREQQVLSSGSGVIFSSDGYIVTNNHVIDGATQIQVIHERTVYDANIVGRDPSCDLALLKIEAKNLPVVKLGSSRKVKVGEWVIAVGNPFNLTSTVTAGIVSAKGRNLNLLSSQFPIESFIQTDAAINPGNSGGALVNIAGELVGINTAILSRTGSYTGYGFAVPIDIVSKVVNDFRQYGEIQKALFGAKVIEFDSKYAEQNKLKVLQGVAINYLDNDGAADKAGLQQNDVILEVEGYAINTQAEFDELLSYYRPGDAVQMKINREGVVLSKKITFCNRLGTYEILKRVIVPAPELGADIEELSAVEMKKLGIGSGVRILNVKNGMLGRIGVEEGFIIISVNKVPLKEAKQSIEIIKNIKGRVIMEGMNASGVKGYYSFYY